VLGDPGEGVGNQLGGVGVKFAGRVVEHQQPRPVDQGAGHPLLLAAGELFDQVVPGGRGCAVR
jgi:hypothetical protein